MSEQTRRNVLATLGGTVAVGLAGCQGGGDESTATDTTAGDADDPTTTSTESMGTETEMSGTANVRVAHMSPDAPNVDVYVDGNAVLQDVPFRAVSEYLEVPAGPHMVEITAAGDRETVAFEGEIEVAADTDYTVAAIGELTSEDTEFRPAILEDDNSNVAGDTARVRVVHASPDAPAVDVTVASSGDAIVDGAAFGDSAYVEVPAGDYTLQVRGDTDGNDGDVVGEFDVSLEAGNVYTAFAAGYLTPDDDPSDEMFDLTLTVDAMTGGGGDDEMMQQGRVRVAHMSPDAPNVDVYVDGNAVLEDVPFRAVSNYLELSAGSHAVEITAAGDRDVVAFEGDIEVAADTDYTVAAIGELAGEGSEFRPAVLEDDNSDVDDETARVRVVHASPDAPAVDVTVASTGDAIVDGAGFGDSAYVEVPAGTYTLQIRGDTMSNDGDVVAEYPVELAGGTVYTAFAAGYLTPGDEPSDEQFDLTLGVDAGSGGGGVVNPARVRVAHMSPDAPNVDVYVDDSQVLGDVPFRAVSDYLEVPPGERSVEITAAGDRSTVAFEGGVEVDPGLDYTVAAIGELTSEDTAFQPLVLQDDTDDPVRDNARVRVIHASPDAPAVDVTVASTGDAIVDGAEFGQVAEAEVPPGDYTLQIRGDTLTGDGDVVFEKDVTLVPGKVLHTVYAAGYLTPDDEPTDEQFDLTVLQDVTY